MSAKVEYILSLKDQLTAALKNAEGNAKSLDNTMSGLRNTVMGVAAAAGIAFGVQQVKEFARSVVDAGSQVETARIGLTTLLRDSGAARNVINNTMEDATRTPFEFTSLLNANKALISTGLDASRAREDVLNLANAIAATGGGNDELQRMVVNMQQIRNTGKATALDIKQFAYAGININKILADQMGTTTEKVAGMEVSYDMLAAALKKAHDQGGLYANGLENMMDSTAVRISNVSDSLFQLKVKMFDDMKPAVDWFIDGMADGVQMLRDLWDWSVRNSGTIHAVGEAVLFAAGAWGTYKIVQLSIITIQKVQVAWNAIQYASIVLLGDGMLTASALTKLWAGAQVLLNAALTANPIGIVIVLVAGLAYGIYELWKRTATFRAIVMATWGVLKEFGAIVADIFLGLGETMAGVLSFDIDMITSGADRAISAVRDSAERIGNAAREGYQKGLDSYSADNPEKLPGATYLKPPSKATPLKSTVGAGPGKKSDTSRVTGQKSVTINIDIKNLVNELKFNVTNLKESTSKIKEEVVKALMSAVNDSQIVAGS